MAHYRMLVLLFSAVVSLAGMDVTDAAAQTTFQGPQRVNRGADSRETTGVATPQYTSPAYISPYDVRRIDAARLSASQYRALTFQQTPIISDLATTNADLADQWAELAEEFNALDAKVVNVKSKLDLATRDFDDVNASLRQHGITPAIGLLLNHKKGQLEDWQVDGSESHYVNEEMQRSHLKQSSNEMLEYDGSDVTRQASAILFASGYGASSSEHRRLVSQIESLLRDRHTWLQLLSQGHNDYRQKLGELDSTSTAFAKLTTAYRQFINRQVVWIRNNEPLGIADFRKFRDGLGSLFDSRHSADLGYAIGQKWSSNPAGGLTLLVSVLLLFLLRVLAKFWLLGIGKRVRMRESSVATRKCVASLLTCGIAIAYPSILYLIAQWLGTGYVSEATLHVSSGLFAASLVALVVEVPRQLIRTNGFIERHLKIELPRRLRASAYLLLIGIGLVLTTYVTMYSAYIDRGIWRGSVARLGFIVSLLIVAWTLHLALRPKGGFAETLIEKFGGTILYRIRLLFYVLGVGFPLAMIGLSVLGYEFTANAIVVRAGMMFAISLLAATLWAAVKIISSGAWHTLTGTNGDRQFDEYGELPTPRISGALAEHALELKHQLAFLSQCALVLGAFLCIGWLWIDILPSVQMGNPVVWTVQEGVPITALHLVLAAATLFIAFQLAKLLPALFDVLVLQRVSFDEAMEHMSLVIGRFLLFAGGCFIACRLVGIRWEAIQWIVVGLMVGVGFALQDVLRNWLGGIVVLFEKPARLGDLITVGSFTGRVASQKLRTTTLSDEQGREVIIPNKHFVSQDVVNWLGAGRLQAIPIEVAVTRDERPADVCRMLQQLLVDQPELLLSPAPQATLVCVSQKSQRIELRAWIEEGLDASRYRATLTETVIKYLSERNLLAPSQPRQPSLTDSTIRAEANAVYRPRSKRSA